MTNFRKALFSVGDMKDYNVVVNIGMHLVMDIWRLLDGDMLKTVFDVIDIQRLLG